MSTDETTHNHAQPFSRLVVRSLINDIPTQNSTTVPNQPGAQHPSLAELGPTLPDDIADRHPVARHWRCYEHAVDQRIAQAAIMA